MPSDVLPSVNVTKPVGRPAADSVGRTVAVKVTAWVSTTGFADDATVTAVGPGWSISTDAGVAALPAKLPSPAYTALTVWLPTARALVVSRARPSASSGTRPIWVSPSLKMTEPVGVEALLPVATTDAVNVTGWPTTVRARSAVKVVALDMA